MATPYSSLFTRPDTSLLFPGRIAFESSASELSNSDLSTQPQAKPLARLKPRQKSFTRSCRKIAVKEDWKPRTDKENDGTVFKVGQAWVKTTPSNKAVAASQILHELQFHRLAPIVTMMKLKGKVFAKEDINELRNPIEFHLMNEGALLVAKNAPLIPISKDTTIVSADDDRQPQETVEVDGEVYFVKKSNTSDKLTLVTPTSPAKKWAQTGEPLQIALSPKGMTALTPINHTRLGTLVPRTLFSPFATIESQESDELSVTYAHETYKARPQSTPGSSQQTWVLDPPKPSAPPSPDRYYRVTKKKKSYLVAEEFVRKLQNDVYIGKGNIKYQVVQSKKGGYHLEGRDVVAQISEHIPGIFDFQDCDGENHRERLPEDKFQKRAFIEAFIALTILGSTDGRMPNIPFVQSGEGTLAPTLIDLDSMLPDNNHSRIDDDVAPSEIVAPILNGLMQYKMARAPLIGKTKQVATQALRSFVKRRETLYKILEKQRFNASAIRNPNQITDATIAAFKERIEKAKAFLPRLKRSKPLSLQDLLFHIYPTYEKHWNLLGKFDPREKSEKVGSYNWSETAITCFMQDRSALHPEPEINFLVAEQ